MQVASAYTEYFAYFAQKNGKGSLRAAFFRK
jgi:hypothetical protein